MSLRWSLNSLSLLLLLISSCFCYSPGPFFPSPSSNSSSSSLPLRCPPRCFCAHSTVICTGLALNRVPQGIPADTTRLDLQENQIQRLHKGDFRGMRQLRVLHLGDNLIEEVDEGALNPLSSLERLRLGRNRIRSLPEGTFAAMRKLRRLDLSGNGLWSLSVEQLAGPAELVSLQLDNNHLQCIDPLALSQWPSLESLSLASNALSTLAPLDLMAMPNLRTLRLSDNPWHCDCRLRWLKRLKIASQIRCHRPSHLFGRPLNQISSQQLKCSGLEKRSSGGGSSRRCRDADWCPPGCICTESSPEAVVVYCHDRLLRSVPQRLPPNTVELRLEQNRLTNLDNNSFAHVPNLIRLDLSKNAIERVEAGAFGGLRRLSSLMLFANNLTDLPEGTFSPMGASLQVLLLNGNRLQCLRNGLFRGLGQLKLLSLYDNQIRSIAEPTFAPLANSLQTLHLARNPLICDCNMAWMAHLLANRPIETSGARCHSPKRVARRRIATLLAERFRCVGAERLVTRGAGQCELDRECPEQCHCGGTTVDCSSRQLSALPTSIPRFATSLLLRSNRLSSRLIPLEADLPNLVHLDLSDNQIDALPANFLASLPSLKDLDLSGNTLRSLSAHSLGPSSLSLTNLQLDDNALRCLPLGQFPSLRSLSLRQNPLLSLDGPVLEQLELLDLDGSARFICDCQLRSLVRHLRRKSINGSEAEEQEVPRCASPEGIKGRALVELDETELDCPEGARGGQCSSEEGEFCPSGCECRPNAPTAPGVPRTISVRCSGLGLTKVPEGLPEDTGELLLDNNRIEYLLREQFLPLSRLNKLDLSHNRIRHIARGIFTPFPKLSTLILAYNRIQCIEEGAFDGVGQLRVLSLHDNNLSQLPEAAFAPLLANLSHVALGVNPFWCDCAMDWVGRWLRSRFVEPGIAKCEGPPERRHQLLLSADPFPECQLSRQFSTIPLPPANVLAKCQPCLAHPCAHSGLCHPLPEAQFHCDCATGFHGKQCEPRVDACFSRPCQNGGMCRVLEEGRFRCECPRGFEGERCERATTGDDGCAVWCQNGGSCRNGIGGFHCECPWGFAGAFCEAPICPPSAALPCQNGGICIQHRVSTEPTSAHLEQRCLCPAGFLGPDCSVSEVFEVSRKVARMERAHEVNDTGNELNKQMIPPGTMQRDCPFAFAGAQCQQRRAIGLLGRPDDFLQLGEWPETTGGGRELELGLRTQQRGGVVLFAGDPSGAFILLELLQGRLRAAVQLSAANEPPSQLFSPIGNVDDGHLHSVRLRLHGQQLAFCVDSLPFQSVLNSGPTLSLTLGAFPLFLGGIPPELGRRALVYYRLSDASAIRGCLSDILLNGASLDLNLIAVLNNNTSPITECPQAMDLCEGQNCGEKWKCRMDGMRPEGWKCVEETQNKDEAEEEKKKNKENKRKEGDNEMLPECSRQRRGDKVPTMWTDGKQCRVAQSIPICVGACGDAAGSDCCVAVQKRKRRVRVECEPEDGGNERRKERWRMVEVPRKCGCRKAVEGAEHCRGA